MHESSANTYTLQLEQPVRAPCTTVTKHSRSTDHTRPQKLQQSDHGGGQLITSYSSVPLCSTPNGIEVARGGKKDGGISQVGQ